MSASATLSWFAAHEVRLAWRDWAAMMAGGRTTREKLVTGIVLRFRRRACIGSLTPSSRR